MKNILSIFKNDISSLSKRFFALVIALALAFIPALYSWFNLYANWDPYANTGNVPIAIVNCDLGYIVTGEDGSGEETIDLINKGDEIVEQLVENDSINFVKVNTEDEAVEGVKSGDYYGAIVIVSDFSEHMYEIDSALLDYGESSIIFYENAKKNAIAAKICESAVGTVKSTIKESYLTILFQTVFEATRDAGDELVTGDTVDELITTLNGLEKNLYSYADSIDLILKNDAALNYILDSSQDNLAEAKRIASGSTSKVYDTKAQISDVRKDIKSLRKDINSDLRDIDKTFNKLNKMLKQLGSDEKMAVDDAKAMINDTLVLTKEAEDQVNALLELFPSLKSGAYGDEIQLIINTLSTINNSLEDVYSKLEYISINSSYGENLIKVSDACSRIIETDGELVSDILLPEADRMLGDMDETCDLLIPLISALNVTSEDLPKMLNEVETSKDALNVVLINTQSLLRTSAKATGELSSDIASGEAGELVKPLLTVLGSDASEYGAFLAAPVQVKSIDVYQMTTYGSAMVPFYSTLALWVGGVMLVTIFKVEPDTTWLPNIKEHQKFYGKLLLFTFLGQLQTIVIVASDLWLLKAPCENPWLFWLACAYTSFVFVSIIYSLTLAFGDVGKAIVVVIMVLQIAGSSGSYPIELLPDIFGKMYLFFPFPYGINAMREAICGLYGMDYLWYLVKLTVFLVLAHIIGLIVRKPFVGVKHFMEEELEKTGLL